MKSVLNSNLPNAVFKESVADIDPIAVALV
jgi:hypothetical protein